VFPSDVATVVATASGAFFGSGFAFLLEELRRRRVEADRRYSRLLEAQLALGMQLEKLLNVQRGYLDPHRNAPNRHMRLEPLHMSMTDLRVDLSALVFIAEVDDINILQVVYLAEQAYVTAPTALTESNSTIKELASGEAITSGPVNPEASAAVAGFDSAAVANLKRFIDGLYVSVDEAIDSIQGAIGELTSATRRLYPKRKAHHFASLPST
jgi:hypothetical protein